MDENLAPVSVGFGETALRDKLRKLRATWDPQAKVWLVQYGKIGGTELRLLFGPQVDIAQKGEVTP